MPYWGCPELVEQAARSILEQTHRDLRLVVIGDGENPPLTVTDSRLTVYTLPENRGTYFAQAVALAACDSEWFSIHAADDWSEPDRFARLLARGEGVDAVFGGSVQHQGRHVTLRPAKFELGGDRPRHVGSVATGIYRTQAVKALGWWSNPEFRVGYDSMMVNLVLRHLRWVHVPAEFGYHRVIRADSLTRSPRTGLNSRYRRQASQRRAELWDMFKDAPALMQPDAALSSEVMEHSCRLSRLLRHEGSHHRSRGLHRVTPS